MTNFWELMHDCLPRDDADQVGDTYFLETVLSGETPPDQVLHVRNRRHGGNLLPDLRGGASRVRWVDIDIDDSGRLDFPADSFAVVAAFRVFERLTDPAMLAREIARVLAPGGRLVGSASSLEPFNDLSLWNFTPVGLRALLEEAGLHMVAAKPGIDALALTLYWVYGQSEVHSRHFVEPSPLNVEFAKWGASTGRNPALVNNRALQSCGRFAYMAEKRESGVPTRTEWRRKLDETLRRDAPEPSPSAGPSAPRPAHARRSFALRLPRAPGSRPRAGLLRALARLDRPPVLKIDAEWDQTIALELEGGGLAGYEPETLACFLAATRFAPAGWVYDVGANIGLYSLLARRYSERPVVAFEPGPLAAETARRIGRQNALEFPVEELALAERRGDATLYLSDRSDASHSLARGHRASTRTLTVRLDTLDAYVADTGRAPGLLKIDTETTEPDVVRGATQTLRRHRPWLVIEVLHGVREAELEETLGGAGYSWFMITDGPGQKAEKIVGDPTYRFRNWLLVPELPASQFWNEVRAWRQAIEDCAPPGARTERRGGPDAEVLYGWPAAFPAIGSERIP